LIAINNYSSARREALGFEIVLFGIKDSGTASHLEKVFRHSYTPVLNKPRRISVFDGNPTSDKISP
jgi:hypothetical protein